MTMHRRKFAQSIAAAVGVVPVLGASGSFSGTKLAPHQPADVQEGAYRIAPTVAPRIPRTAKFFMDIGVTRNRVPMVCVRGLPSKGQYSVDARTGTYRFSRYDVARGGKVVLHYAYLDVPK